MISSKIPNGVRNAMTKGGNNPDERGTDVELNKYYFVATEDPNLIDGIIKTENINGKSGDVCGSVLCLKYGGYISQDERWFLMKRKIKGEVSVEMFNEIVEYLLWRLGTVKR